MSSAIVVTPSTGDAWATAWEQVVGLHKGRIALSLTNYDATTVPQIAGGSWIEAVGSVYKRDTNDTITGSLTSNALNYVTMVPSGTGGSAILTPTWSDSAPTWSDAYQGYFSGTTRYAGGCWYDGTNYLSKWIYTNRHSGPQSGKAAIAFSGFVDNVSNLNPRGDRVWFTNLGTLYIAIQLPDNSIVTALYSYATYSSGNIIVTLSESAHTSGSSTTMATNTHSSTGGLTDSSITNPYIDNDTNLYHVGVQGASSAAGEARGVEISYTEIVRC